MRADYILLEESKMNLQEVKRIAKTIGVKPGKLSKTNLIKNIQLIEGNFDCFSSATSGECDQTGCIWKADCFDSAKRKTN